MYYYASVYQFLVLMPLFANFLDTVGTLQRELKSGFFKQKENRFLKKELIALLLFPSLACPISVR